MTKIIELLSAVEHPAMEGDIVSLGIAADLKIADAQGGELDPEAEGVDEKIASIKFKLVFPSPDPFSADLKKECGFSSALFFVQICALCVHLGLSAICLPRFPRPHRTGPLQLPYP